MARVTLYPLFQHFRGKLGNLVFRKHGKTTVVYELAKPSRKQISTAKQKANQLKFKEAIAYAKNAMCDPILKMAYRLKAQELNSGNAYNAAIRDFLNKPKLNTIKVQDNKLLIDASDDFRIDKVEIEILNALGEVVNKGSATFSEEDKVWIYIIKLKEKQFLQLIVTVYDVPGNSDTSWVEV